MNHEVEAYKGELRELRNFKKAVQSMELMDVWHEGTKSFYLAAIVKKLSDQEALGHPLDD